MTDNIFTTTAGIQIKYQPVDLLDFQLAQNAVRQEFVERGEPIEPPTYEIEILDGVDKERESYTEATIKDAPEEDKKLWQLHIEALARLADATQERTAMVFLEGMIFDMPEDDTWAKRRKKLFNEDVPEDEDERRLYYVNKVLLKTPADKNGLQEAIYLLSMTGADEEAIAVMQELFRGQMAEAQREIIADLKAATIKRSETEELVLQPDSEGRNGSQSVEQDTKRVSETV